MIKHTNGKHRIVRKMKPPRDGVAKKLYIFVFKLFRIHDIESKVDQ